MAFPLPQEIWKTIFNFLFQTLEVNHCKNLFALKFVNREFNLIFDQIFKESKNVISLMIHEQSPEECLRFIEHFRKTDVFAKVGDSYAQKDPLDFICYALTCEYPTEFHLQQLAQIILNSRLLFNPGDFEYLKLIQYIADNTNQGIKTFFESTRTPFLLARFLSSSAYDLRGLNAPYTDFSLLDLEESNFSGANLAYCIFKNTGLNQTNFSDADLCHAIFKDISSECVINILPISCSSSPRDDSQVKRILDKLFTDFDSNPDSSFRRAIAQGLMLRFNTYRFIDASRVLDEVVLISPFFSDKNVEKPWFSFMQHRLFIDKETVLGSLKLYRQELDKEKKSFYREFSA